MTSEFLDYFMIAILTFCVLMFVTGNGERLLTMFGSDKTGAMEAYDKPKMIRASGILCTVLLADELLLFFAADKLPWIAIATVIVTIVALAVYVWYIKKYARK